MVEEPVAEGPPGFDEGRPRLAPADSVHPQPASVLERAHRPFRGLGEAASVVGCAVVAQRAQPALQVAYLLARGCSP